MNPGKRTALFPGSFDPITKGHVDVIVKGLDLFDRIVIGIGSNSSKKALFPIEKRMQWLEDVFKDRKQVEIMSYEGLTAAFARKIGASHILRGLRSGYDFEYEQSIAFANKELEPGVETIFLLSSPSYSNISSTIVRDIIVNGGNYTGFVPEGIRF